MPCLEVLLSTFFYQQTAPVFRHFKRLTTGKNEKEYSLHIPTMKL